MEAIQIERIEVRHRNMNQIIFCVCISLLVITSLITVYLQFAMRLKYPYFLRYQWEIGMPTSDSTPIPTEQLLLKYITNSDDDSYISKITFEEAPGLEAYTTTASPYSFIMFDANESDTNVYASYRIKEVYVVFNYSTIEDPQHPISLENAEITLSDGRVFHANLGNITMYPKISMSTMTPEDSNQDFGSYFDILCYLSGKDGVIR